MNSTLDTPKQAASAVLSKAGIPGIKYLDQGSRNQKPFTVTSIDPADPDGTLVSHFDTRAEAEKAAKMFPDMKNSITENPISRNYVIFDPKHIRIIGRNGEQLQMSPVDYDPFSTTSKK